MNPVQPITELKVNGVVYSLVFDFEAIAKAEEVLDRPLLTGLKQKDINTPTIRLVQGMLYACLGANHPDISFTQAKALVSRKNWAEVWAMVLTAWASGLADKDEEDVDVGGSESGSPVTNQKRWLSLWSSARYDLHLSESDFWHMTGRQLSVLIRRHRYAQDRQQMLIGLLASVTANFSMCRPKEPLTVMDFMPKKRERPRTEQEIAADFADKFQFIAIPGKPN